MGRRFEIVDVFVDLSFGGNPLAVILDAQCLTSDDMQRIAREFNFSESTFVLPASAADFDYQVRIFTPTQEVPFAGHPNIGTAFVLAEQARRAGKEWPRSYRFDESAGSVNVTLTESDDGRLFAELKAPQALSIGDRADVDLMAEVLGLDSAQIATSQHDPIVASVGLPFLIVALADRQALESVQVNPALLQRLVEQGLTPDIFCYTTTDQPGVLRARVFAPMDGVPEDPATGSANCALCGLLASLSGQDGEQQFVIHQGVEMKRPSLLKARTLRQDGELKGVWIGGFCHPFASGILQDYCA
ncbi:MAG: PhzF family phenazine biosynthesis protein [Woeseiaceae bacterium]